MFNDNTNNKRNNEAPQMRSWRFGSLKNSHINSGTADIGLSMEKRMSEHPNAVNISGAVSPITREMASRTPVKMPPKAAGSCTFSITLALLPPNARPASFNDVGSIFNVSSVERIISGNIMMKSATLPAIAE